MNLDFLLSPDKDTNGGRSNANDYCSGHENTLRSGPSPISLDYIVPRSTEFTNINTQSHHHLSRRFAGSSSPHLHLTSTHEAASNSQKISNSAPSNSSRDQSSSFSRFKGKKSKTPCSPSPLRASSSGDAKPHVCPNCERSFYKLEQLKRHNRLVHLNLRPFICYTCDLSFGTKQNMQVHLTTRKHQHRLETLRGHRSSSYGSSTQKKQ